MRQSAAPTAPQPVPTPEIHIPTNEVYSQVQAKPLAVSPQTSGSSAQKAAMSPLSTQADTKTATTTSASEGWAIFLKRIILFKFEENVRKNHAF